jgi:hypothetical protein
MSSEETTIQMLREEVKDHVEHELVRDTIMSNQIKNIEDKLESLTTDVKSLISMWEQAKGIITFIKWFSTIGGGLIAAILYLKEHLK